MSIRSTRSSHSLPHKQIASSLHSEIGSGDTGTANLSGSAKPNHLWHQLSCLNAKYEPYPWSILVFLCLYQSFIIFLVLLKFLNFLVCRCWIGSISTHSSVHHAEELTEHSKCGRRLWSQQRCSSVQWVEFLLIYNFVSHWLEWRFYLQLLHMHCMNSKRILYLLITYTLRSIRTVLYSIISNFWINYS